jgi:hypothetical protein
MPVLVSIFFQFNLKNKINNASNSTLE